MKGNANISLRSLGAYLISFMFIFSYTLRMFTQINIVYTNFFVCLSGVLALCFIFLNDKFSRRILVYIIIFDIIALVSLVVNGNYEIYRLFMLIAYQGLGLLIFSRKEILSTFNLYFNLLIGYFFICIFLQVDPNSLLNSASANYISILMLTLVILSYIYNIERDKRFPYIRSLLCLIIVIWAGGRSGIITFSFLIIGAILFGDHARNKSKKGFLIIGIKYSITMILSVIIIGGIWKYISEMYLSIDNEGRLFVWNLYWTNTISSLSNIFFGTAMSNEMVFNNYGRNLHNSFLGLHAQFGLIIFMTFIISIFRLIKSYWNDNNKMMIVIVFCMVVRSLTDMAFIPEIFDLVWYYLIMEFLFRRRSKRRIAEI
ncbi:hypothetical protein GCM10008967_07210 [Bacillus carboniphilus]|uniref:Polysaccharide polymerase n=1 Tax=Bacillus carboniphilus TaxID=86663 RepID=A0ABN0VWY0_9BACI